VLADIEVAALERAVEDLRASGAEVAGVRTDVTKSGEVEALVARVFERYGRVDVLCLNAGVSLRGPAWELSVADWRWIYDVNIFGNVYAIRGFIPRMMERGSGRVIITASNSSITVLPALAPYVSSKHALLSIAEVLQQDLIAAGSGISVSVVLPSAIRSTMADAVRNRPADYGRADVPEEVRRASRDFLERFGEDPEVMAEDILRQALDDKRFYIFTDPADAKNVTDRAQSIASGNLAASPALQLGGLK
jgi:NAD(P)-dependent dehydrogenase (short-subunit alcohol dehydrogenase family)